MRLDVLQKSLAIDSIPLPPSRSRNETYQSSD